MTAPDPCEGCDAGALVGFTHSCADLPDGAVFVQRCDECRRFSTDQHAAVDLAHRWATSWGLAEADTPTEPDDWWARLPDQPDTSGASDVATGGTA